MDTALLSKKEKFKTIVRDALDRVKYDLVEEMMLKNSKEDKWPPFVGVSDEQIEKFIQHGVKITIIGEIKDVIQDEEFGKYSKLLRKLHDLFIQGEGESEGAEAIREDMFDIWKKLNKDERNKARELSIALKTSQSTP